MIERVPDRGAGAVLHAIGRRIWSQGHTATILCACAVGGLVLAFYDRLWLPGQILIRRDAFRVFAPLKHYVAERLLAGDLPEWFPYESLGRPIIGATGAGVFHPFTLFHLLLTEHEALRLSTLAACLLAGLGAFVLGRTMRLSRAGAIVAAIAFACSGYIASVTEYFTLLYANSLLPFFCVALDRSFERHVAWGIAPAVLWATVFLSGDIQTAYYYGFVAVLWATTCTTVPRRQALVRTVGVGLLAGLLSGVQLGPALASFLASPRADPAVFHEGALLWSVHPLRLLTLVAAPIGHGQAEMEIAHYFLGVSQVNHPNMGLFAYSLYLGAPVLGFAVVGGWHRRDLRGVALLGCVGLWLALGRYGGLYEVLYHGVPFWSAFRYPEKLMGLVSFSVALLAGAGVDECRRGNGRAWGWLLFAAPCFCLWGILETGSADAWLAESFSAPAALARQMSEALGQAFLASATVAVGVGIVMLAMRRSRLPEAVLLCALVAFVMLDLTRANQEAYQTGPSDIVTAPTLFAEVLKNHAGVQGAGHYRIFSNEGSKFYRPAESAGAAGVFAFVMRQALRPELNAGFRIESMNVYLPVQSARIARLWNLEQQGALGARGFARFNVGYFIGHEDRFSEPPFSEQILAGLPSYKLVLVKNPVAPRPRAYLSRVPLRVDSAVDPGALIRRREFLIGDADFIESPEGALPGPAVGGLVRIQQYEPEEVRLQVETPAPAALVLLDGFEDGWRAVVDDEREVPIWRANGFVRAVAVPAGSHQVTFAYRTPFLVAGAWATVVGLLLCVGLAWYARREQGRRPARSTETAAPPAAESV